MTFGGIHVRLWNHTAISSEFGQHVIEKKLCNEGPKAYPEPPLGDACSSAYSHALFT